VQEVKTNTSEKEEILKKKKDTRMQRWVAALIVCQLSSTHCWWIRVIFIFKWKDWAGPIILL